MQGGTLPLPKKKELKKGMFVNSHPVPNGTNNKIIKRYITQMQGEKSNDELNRLRLNDEVIVPLAKK